jgi:hypothetical protein
MKIKHIAVAIFLGLILGLSSTVSVFHNYSYHNNLAEYAHHNDVNGHDDHEESGCVFTVVQYTESVLDQVIQIISAPLRNINKTTILIGVNNSQVNNGFFARAPPFSL